MRPIFCGNFEYDARQTELERLFRRYGRVERVDMKSGFAFIYMEDERDAEDAIRGLDRMEFGRKGRRLRVEWTKQERGIRRPGGSNSKRSSNARPSKTLFVINFDPHHTRTKDLERHFEPYGKIVSVRIRRNFAFVQYDALEDATKALEATNMSKLIDRVISVEYAVRDDDDRKDGGYSPERDRDRSPVRRSNDRRRSPSPYRRERGSPDYGRGPSPAPYRRERDSPDYGRRRSPSPYRRGGRISSDYGRGASRSPPHKKERVGSRERIDDEPGRIPSPSPYRRERAGSDKARGRSPSPYRRERASSPDNGRAPGGSPYRRERASSPDNGRAPGGSPYRRERASSPDNGRAPGATSPYEEGGIRRTPDNGRARSRSPYRRERDATDNGHGSSRSPPYDRDGASSPVNGRRTSATNSMAEERDSPIGVESPPRERFRSASPPEYTPADE